MTDKEHLELEGAVAVYVLGAAEPEEADEVRSHLESCASCRELRDRLLRAVDLLPFAADEVAPPPRLKSRIMDAARTAPRSEGRVAPPTAVHSAPILDLSRRRWIPASFGVPAQLAVACLALAVFGLSIWNVGLTMGQHQSPTQFNFSGTGKLEAARAQVVELQDQHLTLVSFSHLPTAPPDKVYQLWLIGPNSSPESAGVFLPEGDGTKLMVLSQDLRMYQKIAVTLEKGPEGVGQPTQAPALLGAVH